MIGGFAMGAAVICVRPWLPLNAAAIRGRVRHAWTEELRVPGETPKVYEGGQLLLIRVEAAYIGGRWLTATGVVAVLARDVEAKRDLTEREAAVTQAHVFSLSLTGDDGGCNVCGRQPIEHHEEKRGS